MIRVEKLCDDESACVSDLTLPKAIRRLMVYLATDQFVVILRKGPPIYLELQYSDELGRQNEVYFEGPRDEVVILAEVAAASRAGDPEHLMRMALIGLGVDNPHQQKRVIESFKDVRELFDAIAEQTEYALDFRQALDAAGVTTNPT